MIVLSTTEPYSSITTCGPFESAFAVVLVVATAIQAVLNPKVATQAKILCFITVLDRYLCCIGDAKFES